MTIDEAIATLTEFNVTWSQASHKEKRLAIKLGIEALKRERENRACQKPPRPWLLPGEGSNV